MTSTDDLDPTDDTGGAPNAFALLDMLGFAVRAARRHVRFGLSIAVGTFVLGFAVSKVVPVEYEAKSRILVDETYNKTEALSTPDRPLPNLDPFSGSFELLTQKSTLVSIVDETDLIADTEARRLPLMRAMDAFINRMTGREPTLDGKRDAMAKLLATRIVLKKDGNVVTVQVNWRNPTKAYQIAQVTHQRLIELVRNRDTAAFSAAISILEDEAKRASEAIEPALADVVRARDQNNIASTATPAAVDSDLSQKATHGNVGTTQAHAQAPVPPPNNEAAAAQARNFSAKLAEINGKIQAVENSWHGQQASLNAHLAELRTVYGQAHPQVLQQETLIKAAGEPPTELKELRRSRADLLDDIQEIPEVDSPASANPTRVARRTAGSWHSERTVARAGQTMPGELRANDNPEAAAARAKLTRAIERYNGLAGRLASARLQLIASQATFGMRFVVVTKPEYPRAPMKPVRMIVKYGALALGLLFGFLAGPLRDLVSGIIHDSWQVKLFGLKDLGELVVLEPLER